MTKPTAPPPTRLGAVSVRLVEGVALVKLVGLVDERFTGFGDLGSAKSVVLDVGGMTRMTSFGVRQWLRALDGLKSVSDIYLLRCPTFFVDQLNMVMNFGGGAQVLTVVAPFVCSSCGVESGEIIDVPAERASLAKGDVPLKDCARCGARLEFEETAESYFSFVGKQGASGLSVNVARVLAAESLYRTIEVACDKPARITKLVHGTVTYFRISGTIGSTFRARPFLVGAEGEVVIDLAEVEHYEPTGQTEWRRLLKTLSGQVPSITLVDASEEFLARASESIKLVRNLSLWSVLVPFRCDECGRVSSGSVAYQQTSEPLQPRVCANCAGATRGTLFPISVVSSMLTPPASAKLIEQRDEILSRAHTDAAVARAGESATPTLATDDTILGKYKIVRRLSEGGMAEVFLAKQVGIGGFEKPVALKRIQRQLLESRHLAIDMFLNEAKIAGRLMHPNIVQVLDVGEVGGALYLAMEYVNGKDLRQIVKRLRVERSTMPLGDICFVVREIALALHHAYWSSDMAGNRLSVVHRDVSPHNVIISYDGAVKLLDFGVAMSAVTETSTPMIVGKWLYMSPEHTSSAPLDHRADLFSLGVIMYLLCTGVTPFSGNDPKDIVRAIRGGEFKPFGEAAPDLPKGLAVLVDSLLAANPADRPENGRDVAATLDAIVRSYGINASTASMAQFLATLYSNDEAASVMLVRTNKAFEIGVGSAPTAFDEHLSTAGSQSASLRPNDEFLDASISLHAPAPSPPALPPVATTPPVPFYPSPQAPPRMGSAGEPSIVWLVVGVLMIAAIFGVAIAKCQA